MKTVDEYIRIGIREDLRREGKTYKQIELLEEQIYQDLLKSEGF